MHPLSVRSLVRSPVRLSIYPSVRLFVHSFVQPFLFAATSYCQVVHIRRLLNVSSRREHVCERRDVRNAHVCVQRQWTDRWTDGRTRNANLRGRVHAFSVSLRVAIFLREREKNDDPASVRTRTNDLEWCDRASEKCISRYKRWSKIVELLDILREPFRARFTPR